MKKTQSFSGKIKYVSMSPHGDPEALILTDGTFIRTPPHSLQSKELFAKDETVSGVGELICEEPNPVFHHAKVMVGKKVGSDDSVNKESKEELKEKHKAEVKKRKHAPSEEIKFQGKLAAVGIKPKGEVDRLILEDGTSVHLGKDLDLSVHDISIGDSFEIVGEARLYGKARFVKAEKVRHL